MYPLHLKGNCLFMDNSSLSEIAGCPRAALYKLLCRRQLLKPRAALFFGGAIHKALEIRDRHQELMLTAEVEEAMIDGLITYYQDAQFPVTEYRNLDYAIRTIQSYNTVYKFDPDTALNLPSGHVAVELPFALPVGTIEVNQMVLVSDPDVDAGTPYQKFIDTIQVVFTGKIDRLFHHATGYAIFDHKTTSIGGPSFFDEFYTSLQFKGYKWAAQQLLGQPIVGVTINGLICRPPLKGGNVNRTFDRQMIPIDDTAVIEWQNTFMLVLRNFVHMAMAQTDFPSDPQQSFPINTGKCITKYGKCEYFDVCQLPVNQRMSLLTSGLYEDHTWSPLEDNAKPKPIVEEEFAGLFD